jgi:phage baseplate assembly protein gpV
MINMNKSNVAGTRPINGITSLVSKQERDQIETNKNNIATHASNIATNTASIATNATDISGKQDNLTSASVISLRSVDFPVVVGTGNITLPGNAVLSSGNGAAKIQNGNIIDFTSIQNSLLTNVTLGNTWKYQNSGGYFVRNASNNNIIEFINPSDGSHTWYGVEGTTIPTKFFAWNPSLERLFVSGYALANKYLHRISGTVVRSYGFFRFQGTSGTINMNTTTGVDIPWTNVHVDGQTFTPVGTTQVKIIETGYYEIGFNVYLTSTVQRANPTIRIRVNGLDTAYLAWSYIRSASDHNESSWSLSPVLISLTADDLISVQGRYTSNGITGGCYLYSNSAAINKAYSTLMIKRVA